MPSAPVLDSLMLVSPRLLVTVMLLYVSKISSNAATSSGVTGLFPVLPSCFAPWRRPSACNTLSNPWMSICAIRSTSVASCSGTTPRMILSAVSTPDISYAANALTICRFVSSSYCAMDTGNPELGNAGSGAKVPAAGSRQAQRHHKKTSRNFRPWYCFFRRAAYTVCDRSSILGSARKGRARIDGAPSPYARGSGINKGRFARRLWRCGGQGKTCKLLIHAQHIGRCGYWERAGAHQAPCRLDARRQSSGRCQTRMPAAKHRTSAAERKGFGKTSPAHSARLLTSKLYQTCMQPSGKKSRTFIPNPYLRPRCGRARRPGGAAGRGRAGRRSCARRIRRRTAGAGGRRAACLPFGSSLQMERTGRRGMKSCVP